jgi:hypothetical protein
MKQLSGNCVPLPRLAIRDALLHSEAFATLNRQMLPHPSSYIGEIYWSAVELLNEILVTLQLDGLKEQELVAHKRGILNRVELLMHRCAALSDYLGKLLWCLLPNREGGAKEAKKKMDVQIDRLYKIPINSVKHKSFGLSWIRMSQGDLQTSGYIIIVGPIGGDTHGPIKFRNPSRNDPEGYSFALSLRNVLPALYKMCDIAEDSIVRAGLFVEREMSVHRRDIRVDLLSMTLELLNKLPLYGFPDERGTRVPIFHVIDGAVAITTSRLRMLPGEFRIESEFRSVHAGAGYKLPYWKPDAKHR